MKLFIRSARNKGGIIIQVIAFAAISITILSGFVGWASMSVRVAHKAEHREQIMQIAETGIDYYRWHLAHDSTDYQDGTGVAGPYVHNYYDNEGVKIGSYALTITPPLLGSTIVTVNSTGTLDSDPSIHRAIKARLGKPSFAKFAVLSNSDLSIGANISGPLHSNGYVEYVSGTASNVVTSAKTQGTSTILTDCSGVQKCWGVFAISPDDPRPPASLTTTTARFTAGREIGIPAVDFAGVTVDLTAMRTAAVASGVYYGAAAGGIGYHITLKTNDTFDITTVTGLATGGGGCESFNWWTAPSCPTNAANGTWSINTQSAAVNVPFPANGIIFTEDNVWVDGKIDGARLTIVAAKIPDGGNKKNIIVTNNLLYTATTGVDVIGLIAQDNFWIGLNGQDTMEIDAAIIAQNGRVSRMGYDGCTNQSRTSVTFFGMFASNQRYAYGNLGAGCTTPARPLTGYQTTRTYIYDKNLLYGPPPSFPLTTDNYEIISWDEL